MATFSQIKDIRLTINDPSGFINFIEVATTGDLPAAPEHQAAYKVTADGFYYSTTVESGAVLADYSKLELSVSDDRISSWIDTYNIYEATCRALKAIIAQLGRKMWILRNQDGADSVEFTNIADMYSYYKGILADCTEEKKEQTGNSSGRWGSSKSVNIAGGNI